LPSPHTPGPAADRKDTGGRRDGGACRAGMTRALSQRLHEHGDPHGHTVLEYSEASHSLGYLLPHLPAGLLPPEITDTAADKAARADAWPRAVTFIRQLRTPK
jgi:hypothetical protein